MKNRRARGRQATREAELALQKEHAAASARDAARTIAEHQQRIREELRKCADRKAA
jgi:hypothetical protein